PPPAAPAGQAGAGAGGSGAQPAGATGSAPPPAGGGAAPAPAPAPVTVGAPLEAPSLALMLAQDRKPDTSVAAALKDARAGVGAAAPPGQPATPGTPATPEKADTGGARVSGELLEQLKGKSRYDVAWAAFDLAASEPALTPERVRFLNAVLQTQSAQPRYAETFFLQRLADLADQLRGQPCPRQTVRRALEVVRVGERAASQAEAFPWVRPLLEEAAQRRHEGEVLLLSRGYASLDEADQAVQAAAAAHDACLNQIETVLR